jgi:hypothetical protein
MKKLLFTIFLVVLISIGISATGGGAAIAQENRDKFKNWDSMWKFVYSFTPDEYGMLSESSVDDSALEAFERLKIGAWFHYIQMLKDGYPIDKAVYFSKQHGNPSSPEDIMMGFINNAAFTPEMRDSLYVYYKRYPEYFNDSVYKRFYYLSDEQRSLGKYHYPYNVYEAKSDSLIEELYRCLPPRR